MSTSFSVLSSLGSYDVLFSNSIFENLINQPKDSIFLIDKNIKLLYADKLSPVLTLFRFIEIDAFEENKSFEQVSFYLKQLIGLNVQKHCQLIGVGGGITLDITAFLASILFRGISWVGVPTTLLSQSDSCIGGKSSINCVGVKNLVGTFWPPSCVLISVEFLKTLDEKDVCSGLGEVIKSHLLSSWADFNDLAKNYSCLRKNSDLLVPFIEKSLRVKKKYVELDEFDQGVRHLLNYGHTFGHAIESASFFKIPHGVAVSFGMDLANFVSLSLGYVSKEWFDAVHKILCINYNLFLNDMASLDTNLFFQSFLKDKKNKGQTLGLLLPCGDDGEIAKYYIDFDDRFMQICSNFLKKFV